MLTISHVRRMAVLRRVMHDEEEVDGRLRILRGSAARSALTTYEWLRALACSAEPSEIGRLAVTMITLLRCVNVTRSTIESSRWSDVRVVR